VTERGAKLTGVIALGNTRIGKATQWSQQVLSGRYSIGWEVQAHEEGQLLPIGRRALNWSWDALAAAFLLVALSPLLLLISLLIILDSPGPVFFSQLRVGQNKRRQWGYSSPYHGEVFDLYKFRTMVMGAERKQSQLAGGELFFKPKSDPRVTRLGRFLRKTSLDELPQLVNVIRGDIRLVGNRPLPLYEAERLDQAWQWKRFDAPAGITGLWQISGRSDLDEVERLVLDSYYATHRTFWGDIGILLRTLPALLSRRGAR
jgi:lipopolysaccharide/colanic/teichoic acid biosynthesis glycosyltransferase